MNYTFKKNGIIHVLVIFNETDRSTNTRTIKMEWLLLDDLCYIKVCLKSGQKALAKRKMKSAAKKLKSLSSCGIKYYSTKKWWQLIASSEAIDITLKDFLPPVSKILKESY